MRPRGLSHPRRTTTRRHRPGTTRLLWSRSWLVSVRAPAGVGRETRERIQKLAEERVRQLAEHAEVASPDGAVPPHVANCPSLQQRRHSGGHHVKGAAHAPVRAVSAFATAAAATAISHAESSVSAGSVSLHHALEAPVAALRRGEVRALTVRRVTASSGT